MNNLELFFGNRQLSNYQELPYNEKNNMISFYWPANPSKIYLIMMYDIDAPYPENPDISPYIHYFVANIRGMNLLGGDEILSYEPPEPPKNSKSHRYVFSIYQQPIEYDINIPDRKKLDVIELINQINLIPVHSLIFTVNPTGSPRSILRKPFSLSTSIQPRSVSFSEINRLSNNIKIPTYDNSGYNLNYNNSGNKNSSNNPGIYFKQGAPLTENDMKYCRCILKSAANQPTACLTERAWFETIEGRKCYNPYAVCHASVTGEAGKIDCGLYIDFKNTDDEYIEAYANLNQITIPVPYNREQMLNNINIWKQSKGK